MKEKIKIIQERLDEVRKIADGLKENKGTGWNLINTKVKTFEEILEVLKK